MDDKPASWLLGKCNNCAHSNSLQTTPGGVIDWMDVTGAMLSVCLCCSPNEESPDGRLESPYYPCDVIICDLPSLAECYHGYCELTFIWTAHTTICSVLRKYDKSAILKGSYLCHNIVTKVNLFINSKKIKDSHVKAYITITTIRLCRVWALNYRILTEIGQSNYCCDSSFKCIYLGLSVCGNLINVSKTEMYQWMEICLKFELYIFFWPFSADI